MLSREVMGALALAILWVNALLIAAAALKAAGALGRLGRRFGAAAKGKVVAGEGPDGALAALVVEQVGRLVAGASAPIQFHDRSRACRIYGGRVSTGDGQTLDLGAEADAEVWLDAETSARAARCTSGSAFDAASVEARKARGFARTLLVPVSTGDTVWVAAASGEGDSGARLVSTFEPGAWIRRRAALAYAFALGELAIAGVCTAAAMRPPVFGAVSTAGAAAAFVFFLLVQPLGTAVRDALRPPSRAVRHDVWTRSKGDAPHEVDPPSKTRLLGRGERI